MKNKAKCKSKCHCKKHGTKKEANKVSKILFLFLSISAVLFAMFLRNKDKEKRANENFPPIGEILDIQGCKIHYFNQGAGENIVLLHGKSGSLFDFYLSDFWKKLTAKYNVVAIDLPGYGNSKRANWKDYGFENQAIIVSEVLEKLNIEKPILIGYEESCGIILSMLLKNQDNYKSAILLNDGMPEEISFLEKFFGNKILKNILLWTVLPFMKESQFEEIKPELSAEYQEKIDFDTRVSQILTSYENKKYMRASEFESLYNEKVKTPVKFISASSNRLTPNLIPIVRDYFDNYSVKYIGNFESFLNLIESKEFFDEIE